MSNVFKVSRSGYYRWLKAAPSQRSKTNEKLRGHIHDIWEDSTYSYGSPRIHQQLLREGWEVSRPRVARLMRAMGIASRIRRRWCCTTESNHHWPKAPHLLQRDFAAGRLGRAWLSDITYLRSSRGWLYLTVVLDVGDRRVLGWSLSKSLSAEQTTIAAFKEAVSKRRPTAEQLFHSDQGVQYCCAEFGEVLKPFGMRQSMSRKGNCWDNAPMESFFKTLKYEMALGDGVAFGSYSQARMALFRYIERWYNCRRLHSALDYQSPKQYEQQLQHQAAENVA